MYECQIVADSVGPNGTRLTSLIITIPRIVLAELNTHRVFSRNSASSRAIPFRRQIDRLTADPFVPEEWGSNKRGMQAGKPLDGWRADEADETWGRAMYSAINHARMLHEIGVHKELTNRLLEPFLPHPVLITATEWANFFSLRNHADAQPQIRRAAEAMQAAMEASEPRELQGGDWHLPFIGADERSSLGLERAIAVSVGRCARLSYLTHDGVRDPAKDVALAESLLRNGHMSPFEHVAQAIDLERWQRMTRIVSVLRAEEAHPVDLLPWESLLYSGNLRGWRQLRKCIPGEAVWQGQDRGDSLDEVLQAITS